MGQTLSRWFYPEPSRRISISDIFPELTELYRFLNELNTLINSNDSDSVSFYKDTKIAKKFYDILFDQNIPVYENTREMQNFSKRLERIVDCSEYFYCSNVNNLNRNYFDDVLMEHLLRGSENGYQDNDYQNKLIEEKKKLWYKHADRIKIKIKDYNNLLKKIFVDDSPIQSIGGIKLSQIIYNCLPNGNQFNQDYTNNFTKIYCIGHMYDLTLNLIDVIEYCQDHEINFFNRVDGYQSRLGGNRDNIWKRWWITKQDHSETWCNNHLKEVIEDYKRDKSSVLETIKLLVIGKKDDINGVFKNLRAIIYKINHLDFQILGNIPDNTLIKNNDKLVIKYVTDTSHNLNNNGIEKEIKLGNFSFRSWKELANELKKKLKDKFKITVILPVPADEQITNNEDAKNSKIEYLRIISDIFHTLGGYGNDRNYDNSVALFLESNCRFRIMGQKSTMNKWIKIQNSNLNCQFNDKDDDLNYVGEKENRDATTNEVINIIPPLGPYYYTFGPFERTMNDFDDLLRREKEYFFHNQMDSFIAGIFLKLGYRVLDDRRFRNANNQPNQENQQPAQ